MEWETPKVFSVCDEYLFSFALCSFFDLSCSVSLKSYSHTCTNTPSFTSVRVLCWLLLGQHTCSNICTYIDAIWVDTNGFSVWRFNLSVYTLTKSKFGQTFWCLLWEEIGCENVLKLLNMCKKDVVDSKFKDNTNFLFAAFIITATEFNILKKSCGFREQ